MKTMMLCLVALVMAGCASVPKDTPMSEASTRFLYHRPLPFCASEAGDPTASYPGMDYITLTDVSGDQGLAEAMAIFWSGESVEFTPTGSVTSPLTDSFQHVYTSPLPDQTDISDYVAIWGGIQIDDMDAANVQPKERVCSGGNSLVDKTASVFADISYPRTFPFGERGQVLLLIRYVSGEWRLYYRFAFIMGPLFALQICNPEYAAANISPTDCTLDSSGTITILGKSLDWEAWTENTSTVSGIGFTASSVTFTYPAP